VTVADTGRDIGLGALTAADAAVMPVQDLLVALDRLRGEELDRVIARLARSEAAEFGRFVNELRREGQTFRFRYEGVRVLQMRNSPESRSVLRDMALGQHTGGLPALARSAAQAYLDCAKDQSAALDLLESGADPVLNLALLHLRGIAVDEPLMRRLAQLSHSRDRAVRICVALVLASDPTPRFPSEAVEVIASAASAAGAQQDAKQTTGHGYCTNEEDEYSRYLNALVTISVPNEALRRQAAVQKGSARSLIYISLGRRRDGLARSALLDVAERSETAMLRAWAAEALGVVGSREDLTLLNRLRESDPDVREEAGGPLGPAKVWPVRQAAAGAITAIGERAGKD